MSGCFRKYFSPHRRISSSCLRFFSNFPTDLRKSDLRAHNAREAASRFGRSIAASEPLARLDLARRDSRSLAICRIALGATRGERAGGSFDTKWNTVDSARRSSRSAILARQHPQRISHARSSLPAPSFSHRSSLHCRFRDPLPGSPRCCYRPCDLRRDRNHLRPRSPGDIR